MARALIDLLESVEEAFSVLGGLLLVPDPLVVLALIEHRVDSRTTRPVALHQPTITRNQDTGPLL